MFGLIRRDRPVQLDLVGVDRLHLTPRAEAVASLWTEGGTLPPGLMRALAGRGVLDRVQLFSTDGPGAPLRYRFVGRGITVFGDRWAERRLGKPYAEGHMFRDYAQAIHGEYLSALAECRPGYNHVTAEFPASPGLAARRLSYRQLVLPFYATDGRRAVLVHTERV